MLRAVFDADLPEPARPWLDGVLSRREEVRLQAAFTQRFTDESWRPSDASQRTLAENRISWLAADLDLTTALRMMILIHAVSHVPPANTLVRSWYVSASADGRRAVLRALPLLPRPKQFLDVAIRGARSPDANVFRAIAFHNPYPAAFFPDPEFDALLERVTKGGLVLAEVMGAEERALAGADSSRRGARRSVQGRR